MINNYECGSIAQAIINGTIEYNPPKPKRYVYVVYDDAHGMQGIYANEAVAIRRIWDDMCDYFNMDKDNPYPYDYDGDDRRGWEGCVWYVREEVIE